LENEPSFYHEQIIGCMAKHNVELLQSMLKCPQLRVGQSKMSTGKEQQKLVACFLLTNCTTLCRSTGGYVQKQLKKVQLEA